MQLLIFLFSTNVYSKYLTSPSIGQKSIQCVKGVGRARNVGVAPELPAWELKHLTKYGIAAELASQRQGGEAGPVHTPVTCRDLWVPEGIAEHVLLRKTMYVNAYCTLPNDKRVTILLGHVCYQPRAKIEHFVSIVDSSLVIFNSILSTVGCG